MRISDWSSDVCSSDLDVIALGRAQHHAPFAGLSEDDHAAIADAVAATATADLLNRPVNELPGGERARVLLARVLAGAPEWLPADEPLASIDPAHQLDIPDHLRPPAPPRAGVANGLTGRRSAVEG